MGCACSKRKLSQSEIKGTNLFEIIYSFFLLFYNQLDFFKMKFIILIATVRAFDLAGWMIEFLELVEKTSFTEQEIEHWYKVSSF